MLFSDTYLLGNLLHTFWFLPNVASCYAMRNLLNEKQNQFFHQYKIIVAAGAEAGIGLDALSPVQNAMTKNSLATKTITLSGANLLGIAGLRWSGSEKIFLSLRPLRTVQANFSAYSSSLFINYNCRKPNLLSSNIKDQTLN